MHWIGLLLALAESAPSPTGNVVVEGEVLVVPTPKRHREGLWRVLDDRLNEVISGTWSSSDDTISLGMLPVGWYRIDFLSEKGETIGFTTAAVLASLAATPPPDSPVAVDVAMSWVPESDPQVWELTARLAHRAGIRMVRDRLRWRDVQPEANASFESDTVYDQTAAVQKRARLQLLQVFHDSPSWTWKDEKSRGRVPTDLRDTWRFCRDAASHFRGEVQAWEAWNEGNVRNFGGHTMDELCSHQKAAYWGFRAGNPDALVCWAPLAGVHTEGHYKGIMANGVPPYFDVFAFHTYDWCHSYPRLWEWVVKAASGKPIWVTESDRGIAPDPDSPVGDLTPEMERLKAQFITQSIATSLATGAERHFHFILSQYLEGNGKVQFGLLRHDHTPRMGYVALAAAGRFLAGADFLGRAGDPSQKDVYLFAFRAVPDGEEREVLVAWTEGELDWPDRGRAEAEWSLKIPARPEGVWDYMGRPLDASFPKKLTSAPVYIVLPKGALTSLSLQKAPVEAAPAPTRMPEEDPSTSERAESSPLQSPPAADITAKDTPSPVVLQLYAPDMPLRERTRNWSHEYDRTMVPGENALDLVSYHFGEGTVSGEIRATQVPAGWRCEPKSWEVALGPMERHVQQSVLHLPEEGASEPVGEWVHFEGDFGPAGKTLLAFRVMPRE